MSTPLTANNFSLAEYKRHIFAAQPEAGITLEEVLKPEYWSHVAKDITIGCIIEVRPVDGAYYAELYVANVDRRGQTPQVRVVLKSILQLNDAKTVIPKAKKQDAEDAPKYKIVWRGEKALHTVTRISDNEIIRSEFPTKQDAETWLQRFELGLEE